MLECDLEKTLADKEIVKLNMLWAVYPIKSLLQNIPYIFQTEKSWKNKTNKSLKIL